MSTHSFEIELHDRPGALERLLNKCRRKNLDIVSLHFGAGETAGQRRVSVVFTEACPPAAKVIANLARVYDVIAVTPKAAEATDAPRVHAA